MHSWMCPGGSTSYDWLCVAQCTQWILYNMVHASSTSSDVKHSSKFALERACLKSEKLASL